MTTETTETTPAPKAASAPLPVGGQVMAIVPQSFEEIQRMANTVIIGGIAPSSLIKWAPDNATAEEVQGIARRNTAAVAGVLMAGAELGVPPMAALRMFTSINGKPALYADGNIAVVRKAKDPDGGKIAASISTGVEMIYDYGCPFCTKSRESKEDLREHIKFAHKDQDPTEPAVLLLSDRTYGWCESKRADTGETKREEFSIEDAKLAGLWDENPTVQKYGWHTDASGKRVQGNYMAPNESPWHRYFKRMLKWRAIGYCLRELYAEVLAGMLDEFEAREIEGLIDITPSLPQPTRGRPTPPTPPPPEDEDQTTTQESPESTPDNSGATEVMDPETGEFTKSEPAEQHREEGEAAAPEEGPAQVEVVVPPSFDDLSPPPPPAEDEASDPVGAFLEHIDTTLQAAGDYADLTQFWNELEPTKELADDADALKRANSIYDDHKARLDRKATIAAGQTDLLGGGQ